MTITDAKWETIELLNPKNTFFDTQDVNMSILEQAEKQAKNYRRIIEKSHSLATNKPKIQNIANAIYQSINQKLKDLIKPLNKNEFSSPLPILDERNVTEWLARVDTLSRGSSQDEITQLGCFIIAAIGNEVFKSGQFELATNFANNTQFMQNLIEYTSMDALYKSTTEKKNIISNKISKLEQKHTEISSRVSDQNILFHRDMLEHEKSLKKIQIIIAENHNMIGKTENEISKLGRRNEEYFEEKTNEISHKIEKIKSEADQKINDYIKTTDERIKLKEVTRRWQRVKKNALWTLLGAGIFIISSIISLGIVLYYNAQNIIEFLTPLNIKVIFISTNPMNAIGLQIARITLLAVPLIAYFWVLKIAVRIFMRSLVLMDDADQRATIMDSYYALSIEGMTDERALPMMLWALFRPVPGHGPDGVEPPDFTEAINAGLKGKLLDPR